MNAQRVGVRALRQAAVKPNAFFSSNLPRLAVAAHSQSRAIATTKHTPEDGQNILAAQRKLRPVSPHLTVYDPMQTWLTSSIWTRFTGAVFSGSLYVFGASYLAAPLFGWHLESASLAAAFAGLPLFVKGGLKFALAWPFTFHLFNGTRHLVWDTAKGFAKPMIKQSSWAIWGGSLGVALGLVMFL